MIEKICQTCGKPFSVENHRKDRAKFCGWTCKQSAAGKVGGAHSADKKRGKGSGYVKCGQRHEHRVVAEKMLGRPLREGEIVHHKNRNKKDNRPENLEVISQPDHVREHIPEMLARRKEVAGY